MIRSIVYLIFFATFFTGCSSFRSLTASNKNKAATVQPAPANTTNTSQASVKFIDDIAVSSDKQPVATSQNTAKIFSENNPVEKLSEPVSKSKNEVETASALQMKYAILMNTEVENIKNMDLLKKIDDWYGTRYCMGGTTSKCIDCSAFMQILFSSVYGMNLPRTAREQYRASTRISRTDLAEGDLVFFNTRGGVSHVGFYLQNNKFVHASTGGVTISDLFDPYYLRRFIGVGRIEKATGKLSNPVGGSR